MNQFKVLVVAPKNSGKINLFDHASPHTTEIQLYNHDIDRNAQKIMRVLLKYDEVKFIGNWRDDRNCVIINEISVAASLVINSANQSLHAG